MEFMDIVIKIGACLAAVLAIWAAFYGLIKWFQKQNSQTVDIEKLKTEHEKDMLEVRKEMTEMFKSVNETIADVRKQNIADIESLRKKESDDLKAVKDELCEICRALLATLNGLQQQGCNGEVSKAHTALEKHLNQRAHDQ